MPSDWTNEHKVWKVSEIAARLRCSERTIRMWCEAGLLIAHRTGGGHFRIDANALRAYLGRSEQVAA